LLFHLTWEFIDTSEEGERRVHTLFRKWQPPADAKFQGFYSFVDGRGGVAIMEADSASPLMRMTAPWTSWLRFTVTPIIPIAEASAIDDEALAFRDAAT
jgi:Protein of unknown function (DUF3303)